VNVRHADVRRELDALRIELAELRASRKRLTLAADEERRNIERALHDGVQQRLVGIATSVDLLAPAVDANAGNRQLIDEMRRDVLRALEESRDLAQRIYPPLLDAGGLGVALRAAAGDRGIGVRLDVALNGPCPPEVASAIHLCCLEMLERVEASTPVTVAVLERMGAIAFEVIADCDALEAETPIRDRVEALGGVLTFEVRPGPSTRVAGSLPLS
jgi:signal transduction histidine kinase